MAALAVAVPRRDRRETPERAKGVLLTVSQTGRSAATSFAFVGSPS